jgi:hypothetical protein
MGHAKTAEVGCSGKLAPCDRPSIIATDIFTCQGCPFPVKRSKFSRAFLTSSGFSESQMSFVFPSGPIIDILSLIAYLLNGFMMFNTFPFKIPTRISLVKQKIMVQFVA